MLQSMYEISQCVTLPDLVSQCITLPDTTTRCNTMTKKARHCNTLPEKLSVFFHTLTEIDFHQFQQTFSLYNHCITWPGGNNTLTI